MRVYKFLILLSLCVVIGCRTETTHNNSIRVNIKSNIDRIQNAGIIKDYDVIKLQTTDEALIGEVDKVIVHEDLIYIADLHHSRSVFIFDMNGALVRKIKRLGRGPNEYLNITSIFIDEYDNTLNILDSYPGKLLKFNIDGSGEPEAVFLGGGMAVNDVVSNGDVYIGYTSVSSLGENKNIYFFDREGKVIDSQIEIPKGWESNSFGDVDVFSKYGENIYYKPIYNSNVYSLEDGAFTIKYEIDFGKYAWPEEIKTAKDYRDGIDKEFVSKIYQYHETDKYALIHFLFRGQFMMAVYDKEKGQSEAYSLYHTNEDKYFISFGLIKSISDNKIVTLVTAASVSAIFDDEELLSDYPDQINRLEQKIGNIQPYDNPIIVIYNLKANS